jgi:lysine 2,3-aminomutase
VSGLLDGDHLFIKPENFDLVHDRSGIQHRLKDSQKWVPLGIGSGDEQNQPDEEQE